MQTALLISAGIVMKLEEINMDENKIKALHKLKDSLLSVNGSLLKVDVNKDDIVILLPDIDFGYISKVLATSNSGLAKFYQSVDDNTFTLSGLTIKRYSKEV